MAIHTTSTPEGPLAGRAGKPQNSTKAGIDPAAGLIGVGMERMSLHPASATGRHPRWRRSQLGAGPPRSGERASGLLEKAGWGPLLLGAWAPGQGDPAKLPQTSRIHEPQQRLPGGEPPGEILRMRRTLQAVEGLGQA